MARISGMKLAMENEDAPQVETTEPAKPESPATASPRPGTEQQAGTPLYLQLHRKEARLREDQVDELAAWARKLNRAKSEPGERITDNTLIRVAVDMLLSHVDQLQGSDETALRKSVGL